MATLLLGDNMKEKFKARVTSDSYICNAGFWTTDYYLDLDSGDTLEDVIKKYDGKKIKITIELLEDDKNDK